MIPIVDLPVRPETAHFELDHLLHPARFYDRPADVLADAKLSVEERRAILSSWASDACAVESAPALRRPPCVRAPITFDEIMDALVQLDREVRGGNHHPGPRADTLAEPRRRTVRRLCVNRAHM